ncbi:MAG TPA: protein kinase [Pirellulales bacterium]|nr:protein kinase [Pirellulales bacterium]
MDAHVQAGNFLAAPAVASQLAATVDRPIVERLGTVIGRYKLLEQIGEGGFGIVFMAEQQEPVRRKVALKVLKPGMDTRQVVARFEAERQALALMDHPNIAHVFDGGTTAAGRPYFVMDLVKGVPITEYCDQNQIAPRERLELFLQVCEAVQHAHQKGIIHRDIKPSNVLISRHDGTPVVKVIDFGIAKALGQQLTEKTLFTNFAQLIGTPLYMSPEQAGMSDLDVDTRSDIYSLGVLLYELLTGTTPFDAQRFKDAGFDEMRRIIREEEPPKPSTRVSTVGKAAETASANRKSDPKQLSRLFRGELDWIVMKALEKDRDRRYETSNGLAMDIKRYLRDEPVLACPPSMVYRLRKFARRNQAVLTTMVLVTAALLTTVVVLVISNISISNEEKEKSAALVAKDAALKQSEANQTLILAALDEVYITEAEKRVAAFREVPNQPVANDDPRGTQVERDFLQKGMAFYEKLIQPGNAEPAARLQTAKAYRRVGILQRELKQYDKAADSLAKAVSLLLQLTEESPTEPQRRSELAETYRWQGLLWQFTSEVRQLKEAEKAYRQAIALAGQLVAEFPTNPDLRMHAATYYMGLGATVRPLGRPENAEAEYLQAVKIWRKLVADFPTDRWYRHELAFTLDELGLLWQEVANRPENAEPFLREALELHERLVEEDSTPENCARLAKTQQRVLQILTGTGRSSRTEEAHRVVMGVLEKLAAKFPENADYQSTLLGNYDTLAEILTSAGEEQSAQEIYQRAIRYYETLVAAHQQVPGFRDGLARNQYNLAGLLHKIGKEKEAAKAYREAIAIWEALANDSRSNAKYPQHLAHSFGQLAAVLNEDGQPEEATTAWQRQVKSCQEIMARWPEKADTRELLWRAYHNLGVAQRSGGQHEQAVASFAQAAEVAEKLVCDFPDNAWYFDRLHDAHVELALTFIWGHRCDEGAKFYGEAIKLKPNDAMLWFRRAEFYARLGLWDLAAKDSSAAFKLQPLPTSLQCWSHALLSVYIGHLNSYRDLCELMLKRFLASKDYGAHQNALPRACTLPNSAPADVVAWALQRAKAASQHAAIAPWDVYALGLAYFRSGNYTQAIEQLERSLAAGTAWDASWLSYPALALTYHHVGRRKDAEAALEQAGCVIDRGLDVLARGPAGTLPASWWEDWLGLNLLYREAKTLIDGSPPAEDPRLFVARARAFAALGDEKNASESYAKAAEQVEVLREALTRAVEKSPYHAAAWRGCGEHFANWGLLPEAAADFARADKLEQPPNSLACVTHALLRAYLGDAPGYGEACRPMLARFTDSTDPEDWNHVVQMLTILPDSQAEPAQAVELAERAVADKKHAWRVAFLGLALFRARDFQRAATALEESLAIDANWNPPWVHSALAMAWHQLGSGEQAAAALARAAGVRDQRLDFMLARGPGHWPCLWFDAVYAELLYKEAHALVYGSPLPDDPRWLLVRGRALRAIGRPEEAQAALKQAFALAPDSLILRLQALPHVNEADAYAQALADLRAFWKEHPQQSPAALLAMAQVQGRWGLEHLNTGSLPTVVEALAAAAACYENLLGQIAGHDQSAKNLGVLATADDIAWYRHELGYVLVWHGYLLSQLGQLPEAQAVLCRGVEVHERLVADVPDRTDYKDRLIWSQVNLGHVYRARGDRNGAEQAYHDAVACAEGIGLYNDDVAKGYESLGEIYREAGRLAEAVETRRKVVAAWEKRAGETNEVDARRRLAEENQHLARLLLEIGDNEAAVTAYRRAVDLWDALVREHPDSADYFERSCEASSTLSGALASAGRADEALQPLLTLADLAEKRLHDSPEQWRGVREIHTGLAKFFFVGGRIREGATTYDRAITHRPHEAGVWGRRGEFYMRLGLWDRAAHDITMDCQLGAAANPHQWLAHALLSLQAGDLEAYRKACRQIPERFKTAADCAGLDNELVRACCIAQSPDADVSWALRISEAAVERAPQAAWEQFALGLARYRSGDYEGAVDAISKTTTWDAGCLSYPVLALAHHRLGREQEARQTLDRATQVIHGLEETYLWKPVGTTMFPCNRLSSLLLYREAFTLIEGRAPPEDVRQRAAQARSWAALGETTAAEEACRRALELGAGNFQVCLACAITHADLGQHSAADAALAAAVRLEPDSAQNLYLLAFAAQKLGKPSVAIDAYAEAIEVEPTNASAHNNLAWLYATCPALELRDPAKALALAKKTVELRPTDGTGWNTLGVAQYRTGDWKAAAEVLNRAMELRKGGDAFDWFFLAMAHCQQGDKKQAGKWYDQAVAWMEKNHPNDEELSRFRAEATELLGTQK